MINSYASYVTHNLFMKINSLASIPSQSKH